MNPRLFITAALLAMLAVSASANTNCNWFTSYRSLDGSCNNLFSPSLGAAGSFYRRGPDGAQYAANNGPITYPQRPYERVISNAICRADPSLLDNDIPHSLFATMFGQFVNHDLENNGFVDPTTLNYPDEIAVPQFDDSFCYIFADIYTYPPNLTLVNVCGPGQPEPQFGTKASQTDIVHGVPQVPNNSSSWLDLNTIYSVNSTQSAALRTGSLGRLLTFDYVDVTTDPGAKFNFFGLFPPDPTAPYSCIDCPPSWGQTNGVVSVPPLLDPALVQPGGQVFQPNQVFVSGDPRVGENGALSMFHTLFIRNHNRHAGLVHTKHPSWTDEEIFQEARRVNIAEYQNIVIYQYLPSEFGHYFAAYVGDYDGYNPEVDADTNVAFATGAFRYGHSTIHNYVPYDACANPTLFNYPAPPGVNLFEAAQTGGVITPIDVFGEIGSFENVIRGLVNTIGAPVDIFIDDVLRNIPFGFPAGGTDLMALDLHRGRENGLANYVRLQEVYGLPSGRIYGSPGCPEWLERSNAADPIACFRKLIPYNDTLMNAVASLYGKVNNIDGFVGLLLEPHVQGTSFPATMGRIIADTYKRVRDGDRFWFENPFQVHPFSESELNRIHSVTMGDLLRLNFNFPSSRQVPDNPYLRPAGYTDTLQDSGSCHSHGK